MNIIHSESEVYDDIPDINQIVTEDDEPVDNIFSEKQQRLLAESLNSSWRPGRDFIAASNVGIFYDLRKPPIVPDTFVSLDVKFAEDIWKKKNRSYFIQEFGKPPEIAVEIVSNRKGGENDAKFGIYAEASVRYYIILDPLLQIQDEMLRIYELSAGGVYVGKTGDFLDGTGLGVMIWDGIFEGRYESWLRWLDEEGKMILTGFERSCIERRRAEQERQRAEKEKQRAEKEKQRAEKEKQRAEKAENRLSVTVRKMLSGGYSLSEIAELTGLSDDEIAGLSEEK